MDTNCEALLQSIGDAVLMLDKDGYIQYANPATTQLTGYTFRDLENRPLSILF